MSIGARLSARFEAAREDARTPEGRRRLKRQYAFESLRLVAPVVGVETADGLIFVSTSDMTVGRSVYVDGQWDPNGLSSALSLAAKHGHGGLAGRTFLEVGGNIGSTTLQAAKIVSRCVVLEPDPDNLRLLRANVAANGHGKRVEVVAAAASASTGTTRLSRSAKNHGDHRVSENGEVEVATVRLDDVLAEHHVTDVGLLWLDAQGHEAQVLSGAPDLLASPPAMVTEFWPPVLRERGDLDLMVEKLSAWSTCLDLSHPADGPTTPAAALVRHANNMTDLLLLP